MTTMEHLYDPDSVLMRRATHASLAIAFTLIVLKLGAFFLTGSVALLSSLIDSLLDSIASFVNYFAVKQSLEPADNEHRFGHGKAEPLAGLAQAAFITGSSLFLAFEAIDRLLHPVAVQHGGIGIGVMLISLILTIILVLYQRYVINKTGSLAIRADAVHYVSDISMNLGVIAALVLAYFFNLDEADPIFALIIAAYIVYSVWQIIAQSLDQLMDKELPDEDRDRIDEIARGNPDVIAIHDLRTRTSGKNVFIQLHLELNGDMNLYQAHTIADDVQARLEEAFPGADVIIHEDPAEI